MMRNVRILLPPERTAKSICHVLATCVWMLGIPLPAKAVELQGYTEPYRTINVAADEMGIIDDLLVREGDEVVVGQPLARLNSDVHEALLAIAEQNMKATGRFDAARADLQLRQERLKKLQWLRVEGDARQEEVDRAAAEAAVAEANVCSAKEDLVTRRLEYDKVKAQLERRTIRAPLSGIVRTLHKEKGELVAPNNPDVLTLVQLDPLYARFTVMSPKASRLSLDQVFSVQLLATKLEAEGIVEFIAPFTDAESGTVVVKLRLANPDRRLRSGERCKIHLLE